MKNTAGIEDDYTPLHLWIRQDQMDRISTEAYQNNITVYSLIRKIIDFYYDNKLNKNGV